MREGTSIGDSSPEARGHAMSVEPNVASIDYMGDRLTFFDCPGSIEFIHDMRYALPVCDAAVVVCEADPRKVPALQVILRELEELGVPRILFLNKIDQASGGLRETLEMLQPASRTPLLLRQIPVWENGVATGFVDLALERAFVYRESAPSTVIEMPAGVVPEEKQARYSMLEKLADYDDALMEQLISDIDPPKDLVFDDLARELREGHVVPVLMGSATEGHGVTRLLKAVRHEAPAIAHTRKRLGIDDKGPALAQVIRTIHTAHGGKLSLSRVLRGAFADGATVVNSRGVEERIGGLARLMGATSSKVTRAEEGDTIAFARLEGLSTGDRFADGKAAPAAAEIPPAASRDPGLRHSCQGPQGRGAARRRARQALRGGPRALLRPGRRNVRDEAQRTGRNASARDDRAARRPVRRDDPYAEADRRLSRDDPRRGDRARAAQEAVGRTRPVRRRRGRGRAARPRRGLRLRRARARRLGAEAVFLVGRSRRKGRPRRAGRSAFRWSTSRSP